VTNLGQQSPQKYFSAVIHTSCFPEWMKEESRGVDD